MKILNPAFNLDNFSRKLKRARKRYLFSDYDGTLAPLTPDRNNVKFYPGVKHLLEKIITSQCSRVIIISGRQTSELVNLLQLENLPEIWGMHGWERLVPGSRIVIEKASEQDLTDLDKEKQWMKTHKFNRYCEYKSRSIAVHWRGMNQEESSRLKTFIKNRWDQLTMKSSMETKFFDGGMELLIPGRDKGYAVQKIISEMDKTDEECMICYLGDDLTDEDGFKAIKNRGLAVLVRPEFRETNADLWIKPPDELLQFFETWLKSSGGEK